MTDESTTRFPPMAESIVNEIVDASGDPRNLMYPRSGPIWPRRTPGVHPCIDDGHVGTTPPRWPDADIPDAMISSGRWQQSMRRHREKDPADDLPEVPLTHRDIREGWGVLNRR
jgi:hypothetical protein